MGYLLFNNKKKQNTTDTCYNMGESQKYTEYNKPDTKDQTYNYIHETSRIAKSVKTQRLLVAWS